MDRRADPFARCARAVVLAAVVVLVGSLAHASAGGLLPGATSMLALSVAVALGCALVLGRAASAGLLVALTVTGQVVVHGALSAMAGHQPPADHGAMPGMHHAPDAAGPGWAVHALQDLVERPAMAAAHLAASALVGLWLAVGEQALWSLVALARCSARRALGHAVRALRVVAGLVHRVRRAAVVRPSHDEPLPQLPLWSRGPARRGPPAVQPTR